MVTQHRLPQSPKVPPKYGGKRGGRAGAGEPNREVHLYGGVMSDNQYDFLLAFYNTTQTEITRYRDREWATPGIFVTALAAIIGFIISNETEAQNLRLAFDIILALLAIGNAFYTLYVHNKLTQQRNVIDRLEYYFGLQNIKVGKRNLVPFSVEKPKDDDFYSVGSMVFGVIFFHSLCLALVYAVLEFGCYTIVSN